MKSFLPRPALHRHNAGAMNYKHIYHAGNFADVAKHVGLLYCLKALRRKEAPFFVLDTHAGRGYYNLGSAEAQKSAEAERGVQKLIANAWSDGALTPYFAALRAKQGKKLGRYPGSPALIANSLRSQDRALFVELLPAEARAMERDLKSSGKLRTEIEDGYAALKTHLPPIERRGLVLIDPPYENLDEFKDLLGAFQQAYRRWPTAIYLIWYPIRSATQRRTVHDRFAALQIPKMLFADLAIYPDDASVGLAGSGLLIVNPPFGADEHLSQAYRAIHQALGAINEGYCEVERLTPERMAQ